MLSPFFAWKDVILRVFCPVFALFIWAKMCYNVSMRRGADPLR